MAIVETTKNVTYAGGNRVATIEQTITRADDCEKVGNLYYRLSDIYRRLDANISDDERAALNQDLARVKEELSTYLGYLEGYESEGV